MLTKQLALLTATAFTSASAYINIIEQPARIQLESRALLAEWKMSYKRGTMMQVLLAVLAACFATKVFFTGHDLRWLCGALSLLVLLPYTFLVVMPLNRTLMAMPDRNDEQVHDRVRRWGILHGGRTVFGALATLAFLWATL